MNNDDEQLIIALEVIRAEVERAGIPALLKAVDISMAVLKLEPEAYMTYKGHLLHAADPKVSQHSDPIALYDLTGIINRYPHELMEVGE